MRVSCRSVEGVTAAVLRVSGDIAPGDDRAVKQALLSVPEGPVFVSFSSSGGDLQAGIEIGRAIWFREAATLVEDTVCASACALAWLAGRPRYMVPDASIGFHAPWRQIANRPEASTAGSAVVGGYLRDIGLTSAAIGYINEPGPQEMRWLTAGDADSLNITVRPWGGDAALPSAPPDAPAPSGAEARADGATPR